MAIKKIDVDDLDYVLGLLDLFIPGLSYRETAQRVFDELPRNVDDRSTWES